jgi:hypothetical protein
MTTFSTGKKAIVRSAAETPPRPVFDRRRTKFTRPGAPFV